MLKKFFAATILLLMMSANCAAMNFSKPYPIGTVSNAGNEDALRISGANKIDATLDNRGNYVTGTANFDGLYLHFDGAALVEKLRGTDESTDFGAIYNSVSFFGGSDVKNSVPYYVFEGSTGIFRIDNDAGLALYLLATETGGGGSMTVIGLRGGKWVKFFTTSDACKVYGISYDFHLTNLSAAGDEIIFTYRSEAGTYRELHYRWDSAAQWFSVRAT